MADHSENTSILIVDDTETNVRLLANVVKKEGYEVMAAYSGEDALDMISEKKPNLILLDVMMPEMNGFEVCRKLKQDDTFRDIPVIFLSALTETDSKVKGFKVGGVDYITKPFQRQEVLARIDLHIKLKKLQAQLQVKVDTLREREERLKRLNEEKDELMRMVSHDFKNPVTGIIGLVEMLQDPPNTFSEDERSDIFGVMRESGGKLLNLVNDLLSNDSKSSMSQLNLKELHLNRLIEEMVELHMPSAISKGIEINRDLEEKVYFELDRHKIEQIVSNLISNALKFTPEGGTITVQLEKSKSEPHAVVIEIIDTGVGMSKTQQESIWENDEGKSEAGTAGETGTGIGLQLVKHFVDLHGGGIKVESTTEEGTHFKITFPEIQKNE